ncbi:MAG: ChbG/HpnK family deacetylase [Spirosomataceae bacterium]
MKTLTQVFLVLIFCINITFAQNHEAIRLIVRSDDIGFCHTANEACMEVFTNGISQSVEIMAPAPWLMEAIQMLKTQPKYDVGVHLVLTSEWEKLRWRPLTYAPSLVDKDGYFPQFIWQNKTLPESDYLLKHTINLAEVEAEFRAQIELVVKYLPNQVSHLSAHMGCSNATKEIMALVKKLSAEYKLPIELPIKTSRVEGFSGAHKSPEQKENDLIQVLSSLPPGTHYLVEHPGHDSGDMKTVGHVGYENVAYDREGVTRAFTSKAVKKVIEERKIQLVSIGEALRF